MTITRESIAGVLALVLAVATGGTWLLRRYAIAHSVLDIPNSRSSHSMPVPRGGGVAIVLAFAAGASAFTVAGVVGLGITAGLLGGGIIVAVIGFVDDHAHIPARWRLLAHFAAAAWVLAWFGGLPPIAVLGHVADFGLAGDVVAVVALVWLLNLYNFMDGIDGIAGVEAVCVCAGGVALALMPASTSGPVGGATSTVALLLPATLAIATLGFLVWNFPPAKIFLGDAGSGFLGLMLGALALNAASNAPNHLWSWTILLGVFVVDASVTLGRRLIGRARVYEAHRSHAYQHAALAVGAHRPVTLAVAAIDVCWLLPIALLVGMGRLDGPLGVAIAYAPLVWLAVHYRAGVAGR